MLRGKRRSSLKVKVKRGRKYPMRLSDPPLPKGKEYGAEIKLHGTDKDRKGKSVEKGWARRKDVPKLRKYERGSRETTRKVVEKLDGVDEAVAELRKRESATSSRASRQWKLATWDRLLKKLGYSGTYLSVDILERAAGVLIASGYRSTYSYVRLAAARHRVEHGPVSWEMELKMRAIGRSASRGLGPARQTEMMLVVEVMAWDCIDGSQPQSIIGARNLVVVATWWMLREIDVAGLLMNSVVTGGRGAMGIKFALQKNDARGEGQVIFLECICSCSSGFRWCPACHLKKQHEKMKRWRRQLV